MPTLLFIEAHVSNQKSGRAFICVLGVSILFCFYDFSIGFWNYSDSVVKVTTDTQKSASYLDIHLEIDNGWRL